MKKLSALVFTVLLACAFVVNVYAKTEQDLIDRISGSITLSDGNEYRLGSDDLTAAKQYLNKYELSSEDVDYILKQIDAAEKIIKKEKSGVFKNFSAANKQELRTLVENVAKYTKVDAEVKNGSVVIYNTDDSGKRTTPFHEATKLVAQTGSSNTMAIIASISLVIVLIGTVLVAKEIKTNN